jgi:hypothetical protein
MNQLKVISYGGGVQSTALVVLSAMGEIDFPQAVFANVGDDSEKQATLDYVQMITPWAANHGIEVIQVKRTGLTLLEDHKSHVEASGSTPLPVKFPNSGLGNRTCTNQWKIQPIGKWLIANGATEYFKAELAIGISVDEIQRATNGRDRKYEHRVFPLLDLGLSRNDCIELIRKAGLPEPPKSSCWFCPFHTLNFWRSSRNSNPELFESVVALE